MKSLKTWHDRVSETRRPTPLVLVQLTTNDESKGIFKVTHVSGINVTVESQLAKKDQVTQCHRCQLYGHGHRNCHAAAVFVKCTGPHQTAECTKRRDAPAKCALCQAPHTANYEGCPKSPYAKKVKVPAQPSKTAVTRPMKIGGSQGLGPPCEKGLRAEGGRHPAALHQHDEAVVHRCCQEEKSVASKPPTKPTPAIVEEVVDYDASETTSRPEANVLASNRLSFRNFRVYLTDWEGARRGGTVILINIGHHADLALDLNNIEATARSTWRPARSSSSLPTKHPTGSRTLNPALKADYNQMARRTKVALDEFRHKCWDDFMIPASESPSEFWRAPGLRERGRQPDRANPSTSARHPHGGRRRRPDTTHLTGSGESHH
ncbi:hypothetical protein Trydic_g17595 [Trypoxylus dichotomus]